MARIIPNVYTEVRAKGLATSRPFGLNTIGIVGTAEKGPVDTPTLVTSKQDMYDIFGEPGDYRSTSTPEGSELTLTRAGALMWDGGASQAYFIRIASSNAAAATRYLTATNPSTGVADGYCAGLEAISVGSWGNQIQYKVEASDIGATVENVFDQSGADPGSYLFDSYDGQTSIDSKQFTFLGIPSADTFRAIASSVTSIEVQRASTGQRTEFDPIHFDGGYLDTVSASDPAEILGSTAGEKLVQSFWTIDAFSMDGIILPVKKGATTDGGFTVKLFKADSNGRPTGSALATHTSSDLTGVTTGYTNEYLAFAATYELEAMTYYCLVMERTSATTDSLYWGSDGSPTDVFTGGVPNYYNGSAWATWTVATSNDLMWFPYFNLAENTCVFVLTDYDTDFLSTQLKKIIWSESAGNAPTASTDALYLTYETGESRKVTIKYDTTEEIYYVVDGYDLINDINDTDTGSELVTAAVTTYGASADKPEYYPYVTTGWQYFGVGAGTGAGSATTGNDGADVTASDYSSGLDLLNNIDAHIILCAGQYSPTVHAALQAHVDNASNTRKERVGVCGHGYGLTLSQIQSSNTALSSKRMIFVSPGITTSNHETGVEETVSAAYSAALLAGFMASVNPSFSPLGKGVPVGGLEYEFTDPQLEQLIKRKINPIRVDPSGGYKWWKALTASGDTSWQQITTVRITDYATIGIRLACESFIGKKNLTSERNSIKSAVQSFMENMSRDQMLTDTNPYIVVVTATRADEVQGIVRVDVEFRPVFAIEYILVTEYVS